MLITKERKLSNGPTLIETDSDEWPIFVRYENGQNGVWKQLVIGKNKTCPFLENNQIEDIYQQMKPNDPVQPPAQEGLEK